MRAENELAEPLETKSKKPNVALVKFEDSFE